MVYMGSKRRIAKYILPIILANRTELQWYVEPFAGGMNLIDKVSGNRIANDNNKYLISLFKHLQNGGQLPLVDNDTYYKVKANKDDYEDWFVGHVGFNCSRLGKFFDCFICDNNGRNYQNEHINNILKQKKLLEDVCFISNDYLKLVLPSCSIIYCDPPYQGTRGYVGKFDHEVFWQWCRDKKAEGHTIFISEYNAPNDFKCAWEMGIKDSLATRTTHIKTEKLFTL